MAKRKAAKDKPCNCVKLVNEALEREEANTVLDIPMSINLSTGKMGPQRMVIATVKSNSKKRGQKKTLFATYCPVCGKKYNE